MKYQSKTTVTTDMQRLAMMIRLGLKASYRAVREWIPELIWLLRELQAELGIRVQLSTPGGEYLLGSIVSGSFGGAAMGYLLAGPMGVVLGAIVGALAGWAGAHVQISIEEELVRLTSA